MEWEEDLCRRSAGGEKVIKSSVIAGPFFLGVAATLSGISFSSDSSLVSFPVTFFSGLSAVHVCNAIPVQYL